MARETSDTPSAPWEAALVLCYLLVTLATLDVPPPTGDEGWRSVVAYDYLRTGRFSNSLFAGYRGYGEDFPVHGRLLSYGQIAALRLFGPGLFAERLPSALAGMGVLILAFRFAARRYGTGIAAFSGLLLVLHPFAWTGFHSARPDALHAFFFLAALLALERAYSTNAPRWFFAAGLVAALGFDAHGNAIIGMAIVAFLTTITWLRGRIGAKSWALAALGGLCGGFWYAATHIGLDWARFRDAWNEDYLAKAPGSWMKAWFWTSRHKHYLFWGARPFRLAELFALAASGLWVWRRYPRLQGAPAVASLAGASALALLIPAWGMQYSLVLLAPLLLCATLAGRDLLARRSCAVRRVVAGLCLAWCGIQSGAYAWEYQGWGRSEGEPSLAEGRREYFAILRALVDDGEVVIGSPVHLPAFLDGSLRSWNALSFWQADRYRETPLGPEMPTMADAVRHFGARTLIIDADARGFWTPTVDMRLLLERECDLIAVIRPRVAIAREVPRGSRTLVYRRRAPQDAGESRPVVEPRR